MLFLSFVVVWVVIWLCVSVILGFFCGDGVLFDVFWDVDVDFDDVMYEDIGKMYCVWVEFVGFD